jgi:hypothetical protein
MIELKSEELSSESELLRSWTNCQPQQNPLQTVGGGGVLQKPSEKEVDRGKIVHHRHGTIWVMSSGKSGQILNNSQKKKKENWSFVARCRHDWEEIKRGNMIRSTPAERYPKVSYMRPEGTMEYYTDQTRPEPKQFDREHILLFSENLGFFPVFPVFSVFSDCFETVCFGCFASIPKQRVSMFWLNRNKQKTHPNSLKESIFGYFFQKI